jgi:hypothetical protein
VRNLLGRWGNTYSPPIYREASTGPQVPARGEAPHTIHLSAGRGSCTTLTLECIPNGTSLPAAPILCCQPGTTSKLAVRRGSPE